MYKKFSIFILALSVVFFYSGSVLAAPTLLSNIDAGGTSNTVTTGAIDTTGATLIVISVNYNTGNTPTISDSKGNSWTALTAHAAAGSVTNQLYYTIPTSVGSGHTFSNTGSGNFSTISVTAYTGTAAATVFDQENGANSTSATTLQTGSVTPSQNGELIVAGLGFNQNGIPTSINSSFTQVDSEEFSSGNHYGGSDAYIVQGTAGAVNPTWTRTNSGASMAVSIATFKATAIPAVQNNPTFNTTGQINFTGQLIIQ